jgi:hypothetical protein
MYNGRKKLKYDSYLDEDGDLFIWIDEREGYRWYPKSLWDADQTGVDGFVNHIARKTLPTQIDISRLRTLAEISLAGRAIASTGLTRDDVFASLAELGQG